MWSVAGGQKLLAACHLGQLLTSAPAACSHRGHLDSLGRGFQSSRRALKSVGLCEIARFLGRLNCFFNLNCIYVCVITGTHAISHAHGGSEDNLWGQAWVSRHLYPPRPLDSLRRVFYNSACVKCMGRWRRLPWQASLRQSQALGIWGCHPQEESWMVRGSWGRKQEGSRVQTSAVGRAESLGGFPRSFKAWMLRTPGLHLLASIDMCIHTSS